MAARTLQLTDLDELVPHPENPKDHAVALLGASIDEFGLVEPIVLDERTGFIISGHGRRKLLIERRQSKPGEIPDGVTVADGRWKVDVVRGWASRDDGHARTALVTLNSVGPKGGWLASLGRRARAHRRRRAAGGDGFLRRRVTETRVAA